MTPSLSLIVACRDDELYIDRSVGAALRSTPALEVLIVDAGSRDDSMLVQKEWAMRDRRVRLLSLPRCLRSDAINLALDTARGELVGFITARDVPNPDTLAKLVPLAGRADVVLCGHPGTIDRRQAIELAFEHGALDWWVSSALLRGTDIRLRAASIRGDQAFATLAALQAEHFAALEDIAAESHESNVEQFDRSLDLGELLERSTTLPSLEGQALRTAIARECRRRLARLRTFPLRDRLGAAAALGLVLSQALFDGLLKTPPDTLPFARASSVSGWLKQLKR